MVDLNKDKRFFVGVKGVIFDDQGKILILQDSTKKDFWDVPGGKIDADESIEEALKREISEELPESHNLQIGQLLGAYRVKKDIKKDVSLVLIFYRITVDLPENIVLSTEHSDFKWVTQEEAIKKCHEGVRHVISALA